MRLNVNRDLLSRELSIAQSVVEKKATIAILTNVLLKAEGDSIFLTATDLDLTYQNSVSASIQSEGMVTVLAAKIAEIFRVILADDVKIYMTENDRLKIETDSTSYELPTQNAADYPRVPEVGDFGGLTVDQSLLRAAFDRVIPSIAQDEYKYQYGAILARIEDGSLTMVSIDGYRLNHVRIPARLDPGTDFPDILITRKAAQEIMKIDEEKEARLVQHEKFIAFLYGSRKMTCRQPQVSFPDFSGFMDNPGGREFLFNREEMADALKRVTVVSSGNYLGVKFILDGNTLTLDGSHPDYGEAKESISVRNEGEPATIIFNSRYLQDFLSTTRAETIKVMFADPGKKVFFLPQGEEDVQHTNILMPITL